VKVFEVIDDANYLLKKQKEMLKKELEDADIIGVVTRTDGIELLHKLFGIFESDLSSEELRRIEEWSKGE